MKVPCMHHLPALSGADYYESGEERLAQGERQAQCPDCKLWFWDDEMGTRPARSETKGESL